MSGRRVVIQLPDDRRLELVVQPRLLSSELLDMVASHHALREKKFFSLAFKDSTGHWQWLSSERRVLDHEFPRKASHETLHLYFLVKFYVDSITHLRDSQTVNLFFLQAKSSVYKNEIETDSETVFKLAGFAMQATHGDYLSDDVAFSQMKKLPLIPTSVLKEHPSLSYCEGRVLEQYKEHMGIARGQAIVQYMSIVSSLNTYGVHFYSVKDKAGIPWWLGISYRGIAQYDFTDRRVPRRFFLWKQLENLYFRDRKFSIEVHDPKRVVHALSSFNLYEDAIEQPPSQQDDLLDAISDATTQVSVSRRTFGPGNVNVYVWFAQNQALTKAIWSMAICQHQFYQDRKHLKEPTRSLSEVAAGLSCSTQSLSLSHSGSSSSSNLSRGDDDSFNLTISRSESDLSDSSRAARMELVSALKARKEALEAKLLEKSKELRLLCMKESELTGILPPEIPLDPGESPPKVRRRIGTAFTIPQNIINKLKSKDHKEEESLAALELDYEIQSRITSAAWRLANDGSASRSLRRQRQRSYQQARLKLKELDNKLRQLRHTTPPKQRKKPRPDDSTSLSSAASPKIEESRTDLPNTASVSRSSSQIKSDTGTNNRSSSAGVMYNIPHQRTSLAYNSLDDLDGPPHEKFGSLDRRRQSLSKLESRSLDNLDAPESSSSSSTEKGPSPPPQTFPRSMSHAGFPRPVPVETHFPADSRLASYTLPAPRTGIRSHVVVQRTGDSPVATMAAYPPPRKKVEKEWYETSVDSPTPSRKNMSLNTSIDSNDSSGKSITRSVASIPRTDFVNRTERLQESVSRLNYNSMPRTECISRSDSRIERIPSSDPVYRAECLPVIEAPVRSESVSRVNSISRTEGPSVPRLDGHLSAPTKTDSLSSLAWTATRADDLPPSLPRADSSSRVESIPRSDSISRTNSFNRPECVSRTDSFVNGDTLMSPNGTMLNVQEAKLEHDAAKYQAVLPFESPKNKTVISVGQWQPYREVTKPFEMSDFYKYSTKFRKKSGSPNTTISSLDQTIENLSELNVTHLSDQSLASSVSLKADEEGATKRPYQKGVYQPLQPMTCEPLKRKESLAEDFHKEMWAWYEDREPPPAPATSTARSATLV